MDDAAPYELAQADTTVAPGTSVADGPAVDTVYAGRYSDDARITDPQRLRAAIEAVEDTRLRFQLNVSEDLACEALAYRLESALGS